MVQIVAKGKEDDKRAVENKLINKNRLERTIQEYGDKLIGASQEIIHMQKRIDRNIEDLKKEAKRIQDERKIREAKFKQQEEE